MNERGLIVAVSGPSGVGKGTVLARVEEIMEKAAPGSVGHSISVTTRAPRGAEQDGVEYYFRTKEQFEQMIADGKIVEYDKYVDNYYGTPSEPLVKMMDNGQDILFDITIEGSLALDRKFGDDAVTIFILPPSMEVLENRLRGRGTETEEKIQLRMEQARNEIKRAGEFARKPKASSNLRPCWPRTR